MTGGNYVDCCACLISYSDDMYKEAGCEIY